ncbi:hypothetical protein [Albimonas pacifica]|uniref:hypothetical protein n=1 Tax=Albimonas pacifica TaxID=1114924 RepID=UPI001160C5AE|nr:hypothetical protein [Albimonas pacifica]
MSGKAEAVTTPVSSFPLFVDSAVDEYVFADGAVLAPLSAGGTNAGYTPSDFGNLGFREKQFDDEADRAEWSGSEAIALSSIGYKGEGFQIGYDMNQPGSATRIAISRIQVLIDGVMIWDLDPLVAAIAATTSADDNIVFNPAAAECATCQITQKPLGQGVDAVLKIPVGLVVQAGAAQNAVFTGASVMTFRWKQDFETKSDGGGEQWSLLADGVGTRLAPDEVLTYTPIPLPAAAAMLPAGLAAFGLARGRRRRA